MADGQQLPWAGLFDDYIARGHEMFRMTALDEADVAVLPFDLTHVLEDRASRQWFEEFVTIADRSGKKILCFYWSDSADDIDDSRLVIFRTSLNSTSRGRGQFAMPAFIEDFLVRYGAGQIALCKGEEPPSVGFCGYVPRIPSGSISEKVKWFVRRMLAWYPNNASLRALAVEIIRESIVIESRIIERDRFWAGQSFAAGAVDLDQMKMVRASYVENLVGSDYALCIRGAGNYSIRFYEALSMGRVPVLVDSDGALPWHGDVGLDQFALRVPYKALKQLPSIVHRHFEENRVDGLHTMQRTARRVWQEYFSAAGFFRRIALDRYWERASA